jgi:hypothetical protein
MESEIMKEFFQVVIVVLLAVPFLYMAYDISKELVKKSYKFLSSKAKPVLTGIVSFFLE